MNSEKIAIIGGSRGADLALLLGSYYSDIKCVVGIVASNVTFLAIQIILRLLRGHFKKRNYHLCQLMRKLSF
ncbi:MAG: hypothetical protein IPL10_20595 [Bacteroidetes bacterium]|nr:hypothetical protein [Bacteroidota bacterium]